MSDTSTTIRERVAIAIHKAVMAKGSNLGMKMQPAYAAADAAIAIIVEVYRSGQASLLKDEHDEQKIKEES